MIKTSEAWKQKHTEQLLPETFVEIECAITETGVQKDAVSSSTEEALFSNAFRVSGNTSSVAAQKYATLEHNLWTLDGTKKILGNVIKTDYGYIHPNIGYASDDDNGNVTLTLPEVHDVMIPGVTIWWCSEYEEYPSAFTVTAYNGETVVAQTSVTGNTKQMVLVDCEMSGYDRVTVTIDEWCLPNRRCRVEKIILGHILVFTKDDILSYSHEQTGDINSGELPKNSIRFSVDNIDGRWNPANPTGIEKYLMERQRLDVRYGMDIDGSIEWIPAGVFYLSEWSAPANGIEASFEARDALEYMMHDKYAGVTSGTLRDIVASAFSQSLTAGNGLPSGYKRLECIESSGTQYIDTGFNPSDNSRVLITVSDISKAGFLFGARDPYVADIKQGFGAYATSATTIRSDYFTETKTETVGSMIEKATIEKNGNVLKAYGKTITNTPVSSRTVPYPLYLMSLNNNGTATANSSIKVYSCRIYDNGTLVRNFIPCKNASGEVGMYDTVTAQFFGNKGTGTFAASATTSDDESFVCEVSVDDALANYTATVPDSLKEATVAEILQYCANAAGCVMYQSHDGVFRIERLKHDEIDYAILGEFSYSYPEIELSKQLRNVVLKYGDNEFTLPVSSSGENQTLTNDLISTAAQAEEVAAWVRDGLASRKNINGEFRVDPCLDCFDLVKIETRYGDMAAVLTDIKYTFSGAFRATYKGRVMNAETEAIT